MPRISATIVAHNEGHRIGRAISSLACADEIVLVDDGSTDNTREIAAALGARVVVNQPWPGPAAQKNLAAQLARHDWILSLDADEELDREAQQAVLQWKSSEPRAAGYRFRRRAFFLGRWIRHSGWYPDYKLRLYDRRRGEFQPAPVHDSVRVAGRVETLPGHILHFPVETLEEYRQQLDRYVERIGDHLAQQGKRPGLGLRYLAPAWRWMHVYLVHAGFLDGRAGWIIVREEARYVYRKYRRALELLTQRSAGCAL
jgi:glycosyltransferase involved in cell wall biosynthesis